MRLTISMLVLAGAMAAGDGASAQSLESRVLDAPEDIVRMSYPAREGVCVVGSHVRSGGPQTQTDWLPICESGPVRVQIGKDGRRITSIRTYVGGQWRPRAGVVDLGEVSAREASDFLLSLASAAPAEAAEDALTAAVAADAPDPWPRLLELARDSALDGDVRESAIFWLGESAAREATSALAEIADGGETERMQKAAVFALSRRDDPGRVEQLIRIARTHPRPGVVKAAYFWLAESEDPRAVDFFEEVLSSAGSADAG